MRSTVLLGRACVHGMHFTEHVGAHQGEPVDEMIHHIDRGIPKPAWSRKNQNIR